MTDAIEHTVVVDGTAGAENGRAAVEAAAIASLDLGRQVVVVGDESDLTEVLRSSAHDAERLRVLHAPGASMGDGDERLAAREAAIRAGLAVVADDRTADFVSAGNAGVIVRTAHELLPSTPGADRAALAAVYPTLRFHGAHRDPFALLLDVGASVHCSAANLVQFAVMGAAYARAITANPDPRVAILSNTRSARDAPAPLRDADRALSAGNRPLSYLGLISADQIPVGDADVVVTDGFSGNIVIRTLEGVAETGEQLLTKARERFTWRLGVSMLGAGMRRLRVLADWENYGGAPLLGFERTVVVTERGSPTRALVNAIRLCGKIDRLAVSTAVRDALADEIGPD